MWEPVTVGKSGAQVSRRGGDYRKVSADPAIDLVAEGERLQWLRRQGVPAARVLDCRPGMLVTEEVPGRSAAEEWPEHQRPLIVDALAGLARQMHALPVNDCPFDRRLDLTIAEALAGEVDLDDVDPAREGWSRERLVAELLATRPESEDLVVCHGDLCVPNVLFDPETCQVTGVIDGGRVGVADRWVDLAIATRSLRSPMNPQFGAGFADRFLRTYGMLPDLAKIDFFRLLDEF